MARKLITCPKCQTDFHMYNGKSQHSPCDDLPKLADQIESYIKGLTVADCAALRKIIAHNLARDIDTQADVSRVSGAEAPNLYLSDLEIVAIARGFLRAFAQKVG